MVLRNKLHKAFDTKPVLVSRIISVLVLCRICCMKYKEYDQIHLLNEC